MKKLFSICFALLGLTLAVSCNGDKPGGEDTPGGDLVLEASSRYILADGAQATTFTVKNKGVDVTAKTKIINYIAGGGSETLASPSFKTSKIGAHTFYAIYDGVNTEKITVVGATAFPDMAADVMPSKYDFRKRAMIVESTGAWCQWCPLAIKALHDYISLPKADDAVITAAHNGDKLANSKSVQLNNELNVRGSYPAVFLELSNEFNRFPQPDLSAEGIRASVNKVLKSVASTGIAVSSKVVGGKICVKAEIKVGKAGAFAVGALLLEDNLYLKQSNSTSFTGDYIDNHKFVVRAGAPSEKLWESVGGVKKAEAQTKYAYYCEFNVSDIAKIENCRVAIFIYNDDQKACDNAVEVKVGEQAPYEYI